MYCSNKLIYEGQVFVLSILTFLHSCVNIVLITIKALALYLHISTKVSDISILYLHWMGGDVSLG